jgi:hypothetical protein
MTDSTSIITRLNNATNRLFKDWKLLDTSSADLNLDKSYFYYLHARAWALKGWLGGTHSWFAFWSKEKNSWLVLELTDLETLDVQKAKPLYINKVAYTEHSPVISNRTPDAMWFDARPKILGNVLNNFKYKEIEQVCKDYQMQDFDLLSANCNTFASYVIYKLDLGFSKPLRSYGFKNNKHWSLCLK